MNFPAKDQSYGQWVVFWPLIVIAFLSGIGIVIFQQNLFLAIPVALVILGFTILDFKKVFLLFLLLLPLSVELEIPGNLSLKVPTEPLMILLTGITIAMFFKYLPDKKFIKDGLTQLLVLHLFWTFICVIFSAEHVISLKFFLAKFWFILPLTFLPLFFLDLQKDIRMIFWCLFIPTLFILAYVFFRHYQEGFAFDEVNRTMRPFFRNHVNYATFLALLLPFVILASGWYRKRRFEYWIIKFGILFFLVGIIFSYTRASWLSLFVGLGFYWILKKRLVKPVLITCFGIAIAFSLFLASQNKYLDFAPEYTKTIYHQDLDEHLSATIQMKDISTFERFYRWVAAFRMSLEEPVTGFGPGSYYTSYKSFTVSSFRTYVSDNPEKSGVHNYFLMILSEQGYPGLLIFLFLTYFIYKKGEDLYFKIQDPEVKKIIATVLTSITIIYFHCLFSDLIEVDKIGGMFFLNIGILLVISCQSGSDDRQKGDVVVK